MSEVCIRFATAADAATIVRLIRELADFENLIDQVRISEADVLRDGFGERPCFECLLVEAEGAALGFALFYQTYSTFAGRPEIWVEDIFVAEAARGRGVGREAHGAARRARARARLCPSRALGAALEPGAGLLPASRSGARSGLAVLPHRPRRTRATGRRCAMTAGGLGIDQAEYRARLAALRARMAAQDLELCLISTPENIFYLTGLDHWGYFAPHILMVPAEGEMILVTRAMESVTIAHQVQNARFEGHGDQETAADVVLRLLLEHSRPIGRIGIEKWSAGLPIGPRREADARDAGGPTGST